MLKSFRIGGIHPPGNKISKDAPITTVPLPDSVTVPLSQHIGAPAEPCVGKGDYVKAGQLIGQAADLQAFVISFLQISDVIFL